MLKGGAPHKYVNPPKSSYGMNLFGAELKKEKNVYLFWSRLLKEQTGFPLSR